MNGHDAHGLARFRRGHRQVIALLVPITQKLVNRAARLGLLREIDHAVLKCHQERTLIGLFSVGLGRETALREHIFVDNLLDNAHQRHQFLVSLRQHIGEVVGKRFQLLIHRQLAHMLAFFKTFGKGIATVGLSSLVRHGIDKIVKHPVLVLHR